MLTSSASSQNLQLIDDGRTPRALKRRKSATGNTFPFQHALKVRDRLGIAGKAPILEILTRK